MSIALSAFVRPSRTARCLLSGWALAQCAAAWAVGCAAPARFTGATPIAILLACGGMALGGMALRRPKTHRIDISGTGELRVTVQQKMHEPRSARLAKESNVAGRDDSVRVLLPGSVLWPGLMVLRLGGAGVPPQVLPVWRDSLNGDAWRALAVALAVIGRPGRAEDGCDDNR